MPKNIKVIKGLIQSTFFTAEREKACHADKRCPVVTVSRTYGAMGETISRLLADQLTVDHFDSNLIDDIIDEAKVNKHLMKKLDERFVNTIDDWVYSFLAGGFSRSEYYRLLVKAVTAISEVGGIILGRGSHLILSHNPRVFRLNVSGSLEVCARRISARHNVDLGQAKKMVLKHNKDRVKFVKEIFKKFPNERSYYDMSICTDHLEPQDVVDLTIEAMKRRGMYIPGEEVN